MIEPRTVVCGICGKRSTEGNHGDGWPGWGNIQGFSLLSDHCKGEPHLCPEHLDNIAELCSKLASELENG